MDSAMMSFEEYNSQGPLGSSGDMEGCPKLN